MTHTHVQTGKVLFSGSAVVIPGDLAGLTLPIYADGAEREDFELVGQGGAAVNTIGADVITSGLEDNNP